MVQKWKPSMFNEYLGNPEGESWVVYNNYTGALLKLKQELYKALIENQLNNHLKPEHISTLSSRRIIVPLSCDEVGILKKEKEEHIKNVTAIGLQILPTLFCNFSCPYCFEPQSNQFDVISDKVMAAVISYLEKKISPHTRFLTVMWFGGEPLLAMEQIKKLSDHFLEICKLNSLQYYGGIITNGYLLTKNNSRILVEKKISSCQVTLDGPARIHDRRRTLKNGGRTWDTIINNVKHAIDAGLKVTIRMNIDKSNIESIEEFIEDLRKKSLIDHIHISFGVVSDQGNACRGMEDTLLTTSQAEDHITKSKIESLLYGDKEKLRRIKPDFIGCVATARNSIIIGPDGSLYKCPKVVGLKEEVCGSIFNVVSNHSNFRKWELCDNLDLETCQKCSLLPVCRGIGCSYDYTIKNINIFDCDKKKVHENYCNQLVQYYLLKIKAHKSGGSHESFKRDQREE